MVYWIIVAVYGAIFGSFASMLAHRLVQPQLNLMKRSHCIKCGHSLGVMQLIPIFSFCLNKGRCAFCGEAVAWRYILTECIMAGAFLCVYSVYGNDYSVMIVVMCITVIMVVMSLTDLSHMIIPDSLQLILLFCVVSFAYLEGDMTGHLWSALFALGIALILSVGYKIFRKKDGLGMADVKLFPIAGYLLGLEGFVSFMLYAGVLGTLFGLIWTHLYSDKGAPFPFGPALLVSLWTCLLYPSLRFL